MQSFIDIGGQKIMNYNSIRKKDNIYNKCEFLISIQHKNCKMSA